MCSYLFKTNFSRTKNYNKVMQAGPLPHYYSKLFYLNLKVNIYFLEKYTNEGFWDIIILIISYGLE